MAPKSQCETEDECIHLCLETPFFERVVYEVVDGDRIEEAIAIRVAKQTE
jgi:hypothetical protein